MLVATTSNVIAKGLASIGILFLLAESSGPAFLQRNVRTSQRASNLDLPVAYTSAIRINTRYELQICTFSAGNKTTNPQHINFPETNLNLERSSRLIRIASAVPNLSLRGGLSMDADQPPLEKTTPIERRLEELETLLVQGHLSEEEYNRERERLLFSNANVGFDRSELDEQEVYGDEDNYTLERLANNDVARMMSYGQREVDPRPWLASNPQPPPLSPCHGSCLASPPC